MPGPSAILVPGPRTPPAPSARALRKRQAAALKAAAGHRAFVSKYNEDGSPDAQRMAKSHMDAVERYEAEAKACEKALAVPAKR
jgi:hypothetical protein